MNEHIGRFTNRINAQVYEYYSPLPSDEDLNAAWTPLLQILLDTQEWIEIFTTNYDQVIEAAIQLLVEKTSVPEIKTGRVATVRTFLDLSTWQSSMGDDYRTQRGGGLLTKLHGSVDWSKQDETIYVGTPLFSGDHQRQVIIYPGIKGSPRTKPFDVFHDHFGRVLSVASSVVFIGFAFRDEYINEVIRSSVPSRTKIISVNPSGLPAEFPLEARRALEVKAGFDLNSVNKIIDELVP